MKPIVTFFALVILTATVLVSAGQEIRKKSVSIPAPGDTSGRRYDFKVRGSEIDARAINSFEIGKDTEGREVTLRVGKFGPYLTRGEDTASVPEELAPDELSIDKACELLAAPSGDRVIDILVFGGSQGAASFSKVIPEAILSLPQSVRSRLRVVQQCRPEDLGHVRSSYRTGGIVAETAPTWVRVRDFLLTFAMWLLFALMLETEFELFFGRYLEWLGWGDFDTDGHWEVFFERLRPYAQPPSGFWLPASQTMPRSTRAVLPQSLRAEQATAVDNAEVDSSPSHQPPGCRSAIRSAKTLL